MRNASWFLTCGIAALFFLAAVDSASACPMCQLAVKSDTRLPRAYMYSILFMLGMPATLTAGFGLGFYRLARKAARLRNQEEAEAAAIGANRPDPQQSDAA